MDLNTFIESIGYVGITSVVFAESGLFLGAFLPGDSLLFTAGFLASQNIFDIRILIPLCFLAAVAGDSFGYAFGRHVGPRIFRHEDSLLFHREHLERAQKFYEKHGGKTIIIARFMPIVRTFAPILAGVGRMRYSRFLTFNVIGALIWAVGLTAAGFVLGQSVPGIDRYLLPIILAIILTSVAPSVVHIARNREYRHRIAVSIKKFVVQTRKKRKIQIPQDYVNVTTKFYSHATPLRPCAPSAAKEFKARFGGQLWCSCNQPLRLKTTYRLGGPADFFLTPKTIEDTQHVIGSCRELGIPLFILGGGSNVLFSDSGWRGVVLQPANTLITICHSGAESRSCQNGATESDDPLGRPGNWNSLQDDNHTRWETVSASRPLPPKKPALPQDLPLCEVTVGAGASLQQLIIKTHQNRLIGLESFFGIPARVGGALRNNVHGGPDNFDRYVKEATLISLSTGAREIWPHDKFQFSYDHSILHTQRDHLVWEITLQLPCADEAIWQKFDAFFRSWQTYKAATQTAAGTAGCVFKNIPPDTAQRAHVPTSAGAIIDSLCGLNASLRTVKISSLHSNFFQNVADKCGTSRLPLPQTHAESDIAGSSADMLSLINWVREEVSRRKGIDLELEIELVGF